MKSIKEVVKNEDVLKKAIEVFGMESQLEMVIEECSELIQAIQKLKRSAVSLSERGYAVELPVYQSLCEEVADVEIMIDQMRIMLPPQSIDHYKAAKIKRLAARLEERTKPQKAV